MFRPSFPVALCIRTISVYSPGFCCLTVSMQPFLLTIAHSRYITISAQPSPILFALLHSYIIAAVSHIVLSALPSWQGFLCMIMSSSPPALRPNAAQGVLQLPSCTVERTTLNRCLFGHEQAPSTYMFSVESESVCFHIYCSFG